ncbi:MAG: hypothetical protein WA705_24990 [Candidatus Ozemobacteraceae bacterium]
MKRTIWSILLVLAWCSATFALTPQEMTAKQSVEREIAAIKAGTATIVTDFGESSPLVKDLRRVLEHSSTVGTPKSLFFKEKCAKILVPLLLNETTVGGFFQLSPDGRTILSHLPLNKDVQPLFQVSKQAWEAATKANDLPALEVLVPVSEDPSAGDPIELSDLDEYFLIDGVNRLGSKTQEELASLVGQPFIKDRKGRRSGTSKCISYAASFASDWWRLTLGLPPLAGYASFCHGGLEYGLNPRLVEAYYYSTSVSPYTWKQFTSKDLVSAEGISYSPKHFAYVMSSVRPAETAPDSLNKSVTYSLPPNGFCMDEPFHVVFDKGQGDVAVIKEALQRYGIIFAQHTMRFLNDMLSLKFIGVHGISIVGVGKYKGKDVVIYYESFGRNHRDYMEDGFFGPRLRIFPVKFFYQGLAFPHRMRITGKVSGDSWTLAFTDFMGHAIQPETVSVTVNGVNQTIHPQATIQIPLRSGFQRIEVQAFRRYFGAPEEDGSYRRLFLVNQGRQIELREYENVTSALSRTKPSSNGKANANRDYLLKRQGQVGSAMEQALRACGGDRDLLAGIQKEIVSSPVLAKSTLAEQVRTLLRFPQITEPPAR